MNQESNLYAIFRGIVRQEIDQTPGFRELTGRSDLPANVQAETTILGAVMLDNAAMKELGELAIMDFSLSSHQLIFGLMRGKYENSQAIDIVTLAEAFGDGVKEIGGVAYLASLTEGLPWSLKVSEYVAIVQEKAKLRRIMQACSEAIKACQEQREPAAEIVGQLGVALKGIKKGNGK